MSNRLLIKIFQNPRKDYIKIPRVPNNSIMSGGKNPRNKDTIIFQPWLAIDLGISNKRKKELKRIGDPRDLSEKEKFWYTRYHGYSWLSKSLPER
jgi:hypothetical protein